MNKKLFSWKALAGLALLVAMGMTSCKNTTEVDPNDPYNVKKPATPTSKLDGDYDWEVTLTKTADLASLWKTNATAVKKAVKDLDQVDILINCSNYALDGTELAIPNFWSTATGKIVNIVFSGAFKSKVDANGAEKALNVNTNNLSGAEVNIYLPADEFKMVLTADKVKPTLLSESATVLKTLSAVADKTAKKNALTIDESVVVNAIAMNGGLIATTDNVLSKWVVAGTEALVDAKGARVGVKDIAELFVTNLTIDGAATVNNAVKAPMNKIVLNEGASVALGEAKSSIKEIVGLGDITKAAKKNTVTFAGDEDDFSAIGSLKNVILASTTTTKVSDMSIFEDVVFDMPVDLYTNGAANTEFKDEVNVKVENDIDAVEFTNVNFGVKSVLTMAGAVTVSGKNKYMNMWQWDVAKKTYTQVKSDDEDDLSEVNKKATAKYVKVVQKYYSSMPDDVSMVGGKFYFEYVTADKQTQLDNLEDAYDEALEDYKDDIKAQGLAAANGNTKIIAALHKAWTAINGAAAKVETVDADKKDIEIKFTAFTTAEIEAAETKGKTLTDAYSNSVYDPSTAKGLAALQGYKRQYADQLAFVTFVNTKIDGCDWFEIYYAKETTNTPDAVILSFDDDCTINGKAIDVDKLNNLIDTDSNKFTSKKDIWFNVMLGDELLEWSGNSSVGYYLK